MPCNCFGYCANRREKWPSRKGSAETRQLLKNPRPPQNDKRNDKRNWPASASVITSNEPTTCWSGGTGRRTGLKIPRPSLGMWVRPPPPAPNSFQQVSSPIHRFWSNFEQWFLGAGARLGAEYGSASLPPARLALRRRPCAERAHLRSR